MQRKNEKLPPQTLDLEPEAEAQFNYKLLTGHTRSDGTYKTDHQLRMEYITLTDRLIEEIQEGVLVTDPETKQVEHQPYDNVIFLDKSARPVAWLTKELWARLARDEDGNTTPMPTINFLNIDRYQWIDMMDVNGSGILQVDHLPPHILSGLRSIFASPEAKAAAERSSNDLDAIEDELAEGHTALDDKNILIVDEVRSTGRTKDIAVKLLRAAFPTSRVHGTFWMSSQAAKLVPKAGGIAFGNADLPVWYREDTIYGRGVGDRQYESNITPISLTQKLGQYFLSSRLPVPQDPLSSQLRKELHQLATHPDVPIRPNSLRNDYNERITRLNPGKDITKIETEIRNIQAD